ncbi:methyltransferase domain-containing protein [candidate division KSB1 bacterium]|nr:methyltransferase domain-containing protein [candidate division KSB1 bacterium]
MQNQLMCYNCLSDKLSLFYEVSQIPVHSVLLMPNREKAVTYTKGDIRLALCEDCGFIFNTAFNPSLHEYSSEYEETQGFSSTFNAFHHRLANSLIERFDLHNKDVIEIGCGKGEFLTMLCKLGNNRGIGFDPAYIPERNQSDMGEQVTFIKDFYSEKYSNYKADFICCKMTLEHIQDTHKFISTVRNSIGDRQDTIVFFQIPNVHRVLKDLAFWDIYYEHCSYFSPGSLARLFRKCNFDVIDLWNDYDDQYSMIAARPQNSSREFLPAEDDLQEIKNNVTFFLNNCRDKMNEWKNFLKKSKADAKRVVLWGGGSKAVAFLTSLGITDEIEYAIDINPYKNNTFLAGSGHQIKEPAFLKNYKPDVVIVMNPIYCNEIEKDLHEMGLAPHIMHV